MNFGQNVSARMFEVGQQFYKIFYWMSLLVKRQNPPIENTKKDTEDSSQATVQVSEVQYNIVQYSTVQYSTVQYSAVQCSTVQYIHLKHVLFEVLLLLFIIAEPLEDKLAEIGEVN